MSNIFLFSGSNRFSMTAEKKRWMENFRQKHGEENLAVYRDRSVTFKNLLDEVATAPFIAESRLVLIEGPLKLSKDEAKRLQDVIHPQIVLLCVVEIDAAKRGKLPVAIKEYEKIAEHRMFALPSTMQVQQWVRDEVKQYGGSIAPDALARLLEIVGEEQEMLLHEVQKLVLYSGGAIERKHVDEFAVPSGEREVWALMDLIGAGKVEEALLYTKGVLERGDSGQGLWSRLAWMVTQLTLVWTAVQDGVTHPAAVAKHVSVPFPTARSLLPVAKKMSREGLQHIVDTVTNLDYDLKTGAFKATAQEPEEIYAVIDQCILSFRGN